MFGLLDLFSSHCYSVAVVHEAVSRQDPPVATRGQAISLHGSSATAVCDCVKGRRASYSKWRSVFFPDSLICNLWKWPSGTDKHSIFSCMAFFGHFVLNFQIVLGKEKRKWLDLCRVGYSKSIPLNWKKMGERCRLNCNTTSFMYPPSTMKSSLCSYFQQNKWNALLCRNRALKKTF